MKTGNTLRTAKNSLLCFFTTLAAGFLVACGSDGSGDFNFIGGGTPTPMTVAMTVIAPSSPGVPTFSQPDLSTVNFSSYLFDTAAEGVEYSGPTGNGVTGKGGVFLASAEEGGVFEFSIADTALGSVQIRSQDENNAVTPADFIGVVDEAQVITIARIMQALDFDGDLQNGISISQDVRQDQEGVSRLYSELARSTGAIGANQVGDAPKVYEIPSVADAMNHLADTRKCLFSGGYVGDFEGTLAGIDVSGQSYYAVEPFVNQVRVFTDADDQPFLTFDETSTVGVIGSTITLSPGSELSFIAPRLVTGVFQTTNPGDGSTILLATDNLTLAEGNPGATRRIVGVETTNTVMAVAGMYVLDYFEEATVFRGRYYDVDADSNAVSTVSLSLTIANGGSWPTVAMTVATMLTLSGDNATITVGVVRVDENYGSFDGVFATGVDSQLSGTWCDIGGAVGSTVAPTPPTPLIEITVMWSEVSLATSYKLYRSTMTVSVGSTVSVADTQVGGDISTTTYVDTPPAGPDYFYRVEACNSAGCSDDPAPAAGGGDGNGNGGGGGGNGDAPAQPSAPSASAQSDTEIEVTWDAVSLATSYKLYRATVSSGTYDQVGGDISALRYLDSGRSAETEYFYQLEACNSAGCSERSPEVSATTEVAVDDGQCRMGQVLMTGDSCEYRGLEFSVLPNGLFDAGGGFLMDSPRVDVSGTTINDVEIGTFIATRSGTGGDTEWTITDLE